MFNKKTTKDKFLPDNEMVASVRTDAGCVRESNEDSGRHISPNDPELLRRKGTLTIVADGMGGHASGEVASQMAVELVSQIYYEDAEQSAAQALRNAVEQTNQLIYEYSLTDEKLSGMGTTIVALVLQNDRGFVAHVGDSRLYLLRERDFITLTVDHSQVMEMVKHGVISAEEARGHDDKNVILRALGTQPEVEVELSEMFAVKPNDKFLLCSDGLNDMLADEEIKRVVLECEDVYDACEELVNFAKERGGHDNITVGIIHVLPVAELRVSRSVRVTREFEVQKR